MFESGEKWKSSSGPAGAARPLREHINSISTNFVINIQYPLVSRFRGIVNLQYTAKVE